MRMPGSTRQASGSTRSWAAHHCYVRVTATRLWPRGDLALLALGEVVILHGEADLAAIRNELARLNHVEG